jgi:ABC-type polysaccharide/polyol phosphate export permease
MTGSTRPRSSLWSQRWLVWNFAQRDLKSRFKGTALGWGWSMMVPLATILTYTLVFSVIFRAAPPDFGNGRPGFFAIWLFVGLIPWSFFLITVNIAMPTLLANGPLLQKVYFPSYAPILGAALAIFIQTAIELTILVVALVIVGNVGFSWLLIPFWLVTFVTFVTAVAMSLAILNVYYRDIAHLTNVVLGLLFFLTPIIYPVTLVPEEWHGIPLRAIVILNPITEFVESLRKLTYDLEFPAPLLWFGMLAWAAGALVVAAVTYQRRGRDIGEVI